MEEAQIANKTVKIDVMKTGSLFSSMQEWKREKEKKLRS